MSRRGAGATASSVATGGYDTFAALTATGPRRSSEGGADGTNMQQWPLPSKQGVCISANQNIMVHGARWWRLTHSTGGARPTTIYLAPTALPGFPGGTAYTSAAGSSTLPPTTSGWETMMFAVPYEILAGQAATLYAYATGTDLWLSRQPGYFPAPTNSQQGLFTSSEPSGRFAQSTGADAGNIAPTSLVDTVWYWVDPLVTLSLTPAPVGVFKVGQGATNSGPVSGGVMTIAKPDGLKATDVSVIPCFTYAPSTATFTCPGFTEVHRSVIAGTGTFVVLCGTGHTRTPDTWTVTTNSSDWTTLAATSWRGAATTPVVGTLFQGNAGDQDYVIPAVTAAANSQLLMIGQAGFGGYTALTPTMTNQLNRLDIDVKVYGRKHVAGGSTGTTVVNPADDWQNVWGVHVALQPA